MGRLKALPPRLKSMPPRIGPAPGDQAARDRFRVENDPSRKWYRTARWQKLRQAIFLRDLFTCRMCAKVEGDTSKLVCDHVERHRGDEDLFWSPSNLQTLCASPCHNSLKQREDKQKDRGGW